MSYSSSLYLDAAAIGTAEQTLIALISTHQDQLLLLSLSEAIQWLEAQLPDLRDVVSLLTWANAVEQTAASLPAKETLWRQALQTEAYTLRLRAQNLSHRTVNP